MEGTWEVLAIVQVRDVRAMAVGMEAGKTSWIDSKATQKVELHDFVTNLM